MVQVSYPGVYVVEVPSGVHTIAGVSTSVAAFVDRFPRGLANAAIQIFGLADFEREFGGLARYSPASYGIQQFFLNGGTEAWVVRVGRTGAQLFQAASVDLTAAPATGGGTGTGTGTGGTGGGTGSGTGTGTGTSGTGTGTGDTGSGTGDTGTGTGSGTGGTGTGDTGTGTSTGTGTGGTGGTGTGGMGTAGGTVVQVVAGRQLRGVSFENPGTWGNFLRVEVDYDTAALPNANIDPTGTVTQDELFNLTISLVEVRDGRTFTKQTEVFQNLTMRPNVATNALSVVNEGSRLVQLRSPNLQEPPLRPAATGTLGSAPAATLPVGVSTLTVTVDPDGAGGATAVSRTITLGYGPVLVGTDLSSVRPFLEAAIRAAAPNDPLWAGAVVQFTRPTAPGQTGRLRVLLGRGGAGYDPAATISFANDAASPGSPTAAADLGLGAGATVGPQQVRLGGGGDGEIITHTELRGSQAAKSGIFALEDVPIFNILCLPAAADLAMPGQMNATYQAAEAFCLEHRAFLIVDVPENTDTLEEMQGWLTANDTLRHRNAAVYFPRVRISDPLNQGRLKSVAASGTMAGVYAQTDGTRGVWKAPAGIEAQLRGVQQLAVALTDRENGALNPLGVNVLRTFPVYGTVSWGARTLVGADQLASEWKYVPIRRLALFLEESLFRGTKWVVFEPNDEPLWAQIRMNLNAFMLGLFRQGAFQGATPDQAFFVKCDGETTTQADRNLGIVNVEVGFAPLKPAEFVILRIQQIAGKLT